MVPASNLPGTMGTLLGGHSPGKAPWDEERGFASPGEKNEVSLDKSNPPSPPFLRQGPQAWGTQRDPVLMWQPQHLLPAPGGSSKSGNRRGAAHCSSSSPQGALAGHILRMDGSREELALLSSGRFSVNGSAHVSQVPCPGCHTCQPHRALLASPAPPWSQGRCSGHSQGCSTARRAQHPVPSPAKDGDSHRFANVALTPASKPGTKWPPQPSSKGSP